MNIKNNSTKKYDNILLFSNGSIGDFLMGALCADSARKKLTDSKIIILTPRNAAILQDLLSAYPYVSIYETNRHRFLPLLNLLMRVIWQKNMVVNQGVFKEIPFRMWLLAHLLTIRRESIYLHFAQKEISDEYSPERTIIFDYRLLMYENLARLFNTQNLNVLSSIPPYRFIHDPSVLERYSLVKFLYVVVHPCASSTSRSLPAARWTDLLKYIEANFPDTKIVVTGSEKDKLFIQKIFETGIPVTSPINLAGKLSMTELANIIDGARGYIGVDTGITHLAGVLQKRSVIIGNNSNPYWLPRYNKNAIILTENKQCTCDGKKGGDCFYHIDGKKYYKCMLDISEESLYGSIRHMLTV